MAINESSSTERLLAYARYHLTALSADPEVADMAGPVRTLVAELKKKLADAVEAEERTLEAAALLDRAEFEIDRICRKAETEVLRQLQGDRLSAQYKSIFPKGVSALVAQRGAEQAQNVKESAAALKKHYPDLAKDFADPLLDLADRMLSSEEAYNSAQREEAGAGTDERIARSELLRQLQRSRRGLRAQYPNERARVRSYFVPGRRRIDKQDIEEDPEAEENDSN